jgi:hypothetical protein
MRRFVDKLLRTLAPTKEVMETGLFQESTELKKERKKPTRRDRIYHIMRFNQKKMEHLKKLTEGFLVAYDNLSAWDHEPLKQDDFVSGIFTIIEGYISCLLSEMS